MRVLILGADTPLGHVLVEWLQQRGRHQLQTLNRSACRWKSERQAKKAVTRAKCDAVVDLRISATADGDEPLQEADIKRCHWVGKSCQRNRSLYLYVSSSRVFSGELDRPYTEEDYPDNDTTVGEMLAAAEQLVRDSCESHLILRLGPIFSHEAPNLITRMLSEMGQQAGSLVLDNNLRGCPVGASDGARVIAALLDQLGTGMEVRGIFHYGSSDTATFYEFAEALLASASQFSEFSASAVQLQRPAAEPMPLNRALDCSKIRNTFAIKQAPWRAAVPALVKRYYLELSQQKENSGNGKGNG